MGLQASPPSYQVAPRPEVSSLTGSPLLQANIPRPAGRSARGAQQRPNAFSISSAQSTATECDLGRRRDFCPRTQSLEICNAGNENGQRLLALTTNGLTNVQLANVPLGIDARVPATGAAAGGTSVTVRGRRLSAGMTARLGGKPAMVTPIDLNTLTLTRLATTTGTLQLVITNPDGEWVSLDGAFLAQ